MRSYQTKNVSIRLCDEFNNEKRQRNWVLCRHLLHISEQFLTCKDHLENSSERKADFVVYQDQQCEI